MRFLDEEAGRGGGIGSWLLTVLGYGAVMVACDNETEWSIAARIAQKPLRDMLSEVRLARGIRATGYSGSSMTCRAC